jgi:hypothetical protein
MTASISEVVVQQSATARKADGVRAEAIAGGIVRLGIGIAGGAEDSAGGILRFNLSSPQASEEATK